MWTIDDQCYPEELGPEVKAQLHGFLAEYVTTGDQGLIEKGRKLVGRAPWFEAMVVDAERARHRRSRFQVVPNLPGATGRPGEAGAAHQPNLAEAAGPTPATSSGVGRPGVAPEATPEGVGTHGAPLSTGAEASPPAGWDRRKHGRWVGQTELPGAIGEAERSEAPKAEEAAKPVYPKFFLGGTTT
jgi:hypothetical protein